MTAPLTTLPDPELIDLDRQLRSSLPLSYAAAIDPGTADVALVAGSAQWPLRVAGLLGDGIARAVVIDPRPADPESVRALAADEDAIVLSEPLASHPAVSAIADALGGTDTLVLSSSEIRPAADQVFDQIRLLRALGVSDVRPLDVLVNGESILVTLGGARADVAVRVRLSAATTRAGRPRHQVRAYGAAVVVSADLPGPQTARSATVTTSSPTGILAVTAPLETAHRVTLRRVRRGDVASDLEGFATDVALFSDLL